MGDKSLLLQVNDVSMVFGGLRAVSDFSLEVYRGELAGLIGPNGAGKTTVFNMLSAIYKPTDGNIFFWDKKGRVHNAAKLSSDCLNRIGIARTFQNIRLFNNLTAADNIRVALHAHRRINPFDALLRTSRFRNDERHMSDRVDALLTLFKMTDKKNELAQNLAYGEQRKLEICRALAANPALLLLDEPAAGMNPQETHELMNLIALIRKEFNLTILLIEHDMRLVMGICERLVVLDYGRIIAKGLPSDIQKNPAVIKAYLGEEALPDA